MQIIPAYTPNDWYWIVAGDQANVWSSGRAMSVPVADAGYVAWLDAGNAPSQAATMADLENVLATQYPPGTPRTYNAFARYTKASGGVSIGGKPYLSDPVSRNTAASAHDYAVANPGHITDWKLADGTFTQLDEPGLAHVVQMATFVQACFTCESNTLTAINGGSITTLAQIDAAFAAISNVLA
jgi:hypothetical protein